MHIIGLECIGITVEKEFDVDDEEGNFQGRKSYRGIVTRYYDKTKRYRVTFTDGDKTTLSENELLDAMLPVETPSGSELLDATLPVQIRPPCFLSHRIQIPKVLVTSPPPQLLKTHHSSLVPHCNCVAVAAGQNLMIWFNVREQ